MKKLFLAVILLAASTLLGQQTPAIRPFVGFRVGTFQQQNFDSPTLIPSVGVNAKIKRFNFQTVGLINTANLHKTGDGWGKTWVNSGSFNLNRHFGVGGAYIYNTFKATHLQGSSWHSAVFVNYSAGKNRFQLMRHLGASNRMTLDRWDCNYERVLNRRWSATVGLSEFQYKVIPVSHRKYGMEEQFGIKLYLR